MIFLNFLHIQCPLQYSYLFLGFCKHSILLPSPWMNQGMVSVRFNILTSHDLIDPSTYSLIFSDIYPDWVCIVISVKGFKMFHLGALFIACNSSLDYSFWNICVVLISLVFFCTLGDILRHSYRYIFHNICDLCFAVFRYFLSGCWNLLIPSNFPKEVW